MQCLLFLLLLLRLLPGSKAAFSKYGDITTHSGLICNFAKVDTITYIGERACQSCISGHRAGKEGLHVGCNVYTCAGAIPHSCDHGFEDVYCCSTNHCNPREFAATFRCGAMAQEKVEQSPDVAVNVEKERGFSIYLIIAITFLLLIIIIVVIYLIMRHRQRAKKYEERIKMERN